MQTRIDAVYENGVLRPLDPLNLPEHCQVQIVVNPKTDTASRLLPSWPRHVPADMHLADSTVDRSKVQAALAKIPGSFVEEIRREREGRL